MTFSLHQWGVVMSSQIKHTHSHQDTPLSPYTWHISLDFQLLHHFYSLSQPYLEWHPSSLQVITTGAREGHPKEHRAMLKLTRETHSVTYVPGLYTLSDLLHIDAQLSPSFLCCLRPPSHHPSSLTSVSLLLVLHWLRPPTPFWPYGTHPFFPHSQTISILSDLLYSLTPFLFQLPF